MYTYIKEKNNFEAYKIKHPTKPKRPIWDQQMLTDDHDFNLFINARKKYKQDLENYNQSCANWEELSRIKQNEFKTDLEAEAGISNWPTTIKNYIWDFVYNKNNFDFPDLIDLYLTEVELLNNIFINLNISDKTFDILKAEGYVK